MTKDEARVKSLGTKLLIIKFFMKLFIFEVLYEFFKKIQKSCEKYINFNLVRRNCWVKLLYFDTIHDKFIPTDMIALYIIHFPILTSTITNK